MNNKQTKIPKVLHPKPPTKFGVNNNTKKPLNAITESELNLPPKPALRAILSRRSKSFSDFKSAGLHRPEYAPTLKQIKAGKSTFTLNQPSSSVTSNKITRPGVVGTNSRITRNLTSQTGTNSSSRTVANTLQKVGVKRPADTKDQNESKPKVSKPLKPYDYKGRLNLLQEKYSTLQERNKNSEVQLSSAREELVLLKDIQDKFSNVETEYKLLQEEVVTLRKDSKILKILQPKYEKMEKEFQELSESETTLKKYCKIVVADREKFQKELKQVSEEHRILVEEKRIIDDEFSNLQSKNKELEEQLQFYKTHFKKAEEQCRIFHNTVQDLKGNIRVYCRVRPAKSSEMDRFPVLINFTSESSFEIRKSRESMTISGKATDLKQEFNFDKVFPPEATQEDVFEDLAQLVQSALDGYHVCVFAYGQTGSGKTYTMQGENSENSLGMIPRSIKLLFRRIEELSHLGWKYTVQCTFLEIYNETIKDLLNPDSKHQHEIRFNEGKGTTVTNLTTETVHSSGELMQLMYAAQRYRAVASTDFNEHSSRSHFVAKVTVQGQQEDSPAIFYGSINLVDLAGSESAKTSNSDRINETKNINKSLSTLGSVMLALHNKDSHIPYRNSKLTYLLQSCLGGNSKTLMFVNISPFEDCYGESINSLRFAAKVKEVKTGTKRNKMYKV